MSILNFFLDRDIIPIEITVNHDENEQEMQKFFEHLKSKIGHPHKYELSKVQRLKITTVNEPDLTMYLELFKNIVQKTRAIGFIYKLCNATVC